MSMYTDVFQTKFEYYFRLNFKRKLQLYDVSLDLVKNLLNGEHDRDFYKDDNDMIIEYDHNHDIIEDEIKKVYRLMEKRHKNANCSTNEESFVLERIDLSYQLFKIFFSSLEYSSDIGSTTYNLLEFYLQLLFGISLQNNNYAPDQTINDDIIWSMSPIFFQKIYSIDLEDLKYLHHIEVKNYIREHYEDFIRLLKTIEFEIFEFKNRPQSYTLFEIEIVYLKRMKALYYDDTQIFLKQIL